MPRPRTRVALDDLERVNLAGPVVDAMRSLFPGAAAGTVSVLDLRPVGWQPGVVQVEWLACGFGGTRPLWRCPWCRARRRVLYLVRSMVACRGCLSSGGRPLIYASQRHDPSMRAQLRSDALAQRLGGDVGRGVPDKPPRMWWRTWERLARRIVVLEEQRVKRLNNGARLKRLEARAARDGSASGT